MIVQLTDNITANVKLFENTGKVYIFLNKKRRGKETQTIGLSSDELAFLFLSEELRTKVEEMEMIGVSQSIDSLVRKGRREAGKLEEDAPSPRTPQQTPRTPYERPFSKTPRQTYTSSSSSSSSYTSTPRRPTACYRPTPPLPVNLRHPCYQPPPLPVNLRHPSNQPPPLPVNLRHPLPLPDNLRHPSYQPPPLPLNLRQPTSTVTYQRPSPLLPVNSRQATSTTSFLPTSWQPSDATTEENWSVPQQEKSSTLPSTLQPERRVVFRDEYDDYDCEADTEDI